MRNSLLGLAIVAAAMTGMISAQDKATVDGLVFTVTADGTAEVAMDSVAAKPSEVIIPSSVSIDGTSYTVTAVASSGFSEDTSLSSVTLPSTIKTIGATAFYHCSSLKNITLPEGLLTIGAGAFASYGGAGLEEITIPASVETIGSRAFFNAPLLTVTINGDEYSPVLSIGSEAFNGTGVAIKEISVGRLTPPTFPDNAFNSNEYRTTDITLIDMAKGMEYQYATSDGWKNFQSLITTGIDAIKANIDDGFSEDDRSRGGYYFLGGGFAGKSLDSLPSGYYVGSEGVVLKR